MAAGKGRRLKVYQAHLGFYDTVVAAPSQTAALRAWGTHQNLFADGEARVTTDEAAVAAALEHPETPLLRAVGSRDPFSLKPNLPALPDQPARATPRPAPPATAPTPSIAPKPSPKPAPRPAPDRSALDAAEAAVAELETARRREEGILRERRAALDAEDAAARDRYAAARARIEHVVERERRAFAKAGGRPGRAGSS